MNQSPNRPLERRGPVKQEDIDRIQMAWLRVWGEGKCLHVGCGEKYLEGCINIDPNPGRPRVDYRHDVHDLPEYWSGIFDSVISCHVIPALRDPHRAFEEMIRVLRPGGVMAHVVPDNTYAPERHWTNHPWDFQHHNWYSPQEFCEDVLAPFDDLVKWELCKHFRLFRFSFRVRGYKL